MNKTIIRPAEPRDVTGINEIRNYYITNTAYNLSYETETTEETAEWLAAHDGKYPVLAAETDGKTVGWASLSAFKSKEGYSRTVENSVYIHAGYLGRGIGNRLLEAICAEGVRYGFHRIVAVITADNDVSVKLHIKHGFALCGRLGEAGYKFDKYYDVLFLEKKIQRVSKKPNSSDKSP
jgi:phosphinothricin acetyltransferase